jgi:pheromone shutdown protein TraB
MEDNTMTMKEIIKKISLAIVATAAITALTLTAAAAGAPNIGRNIGTWLLDNGAWIVLAVGLLGAAGCAIKRNFTAAGITLGVTALLFVILKNAESIMDIVGGWAKSIIGL